MVTSNLDRLRAGLIEKRHRLLHWMRTTPPHKQRTQLGPVDSQAVQAHLHTLDVTLDNVESPAFGRCEVCHAPIEPEVLEVDYTCCVCLADLSSEERRQLEAELELAQVVQRALLPQQGPVIPGLDLAVFSRPAQIVGGDYFDFCPFRDETHGIVIADVAGHGMAASLLMASLQAALRTLIPVSDSPTSVLEQLNRFFTHNIHFTTFVTLFLGQYDAVQSAFSYASAGHNPALLLHRESPGGRSWLPPTAPAIGLVEEFQSGTATIHLAPDDVLVLYTDGVTEATNPQGEAFGEERLAALVENEAYASAKYLVQALRSSLQAYTERQALTDDMTVLIGKVTR